MSPRDDLADWEARTDALLDSLEHERADADKLSAERYPPDMLAPYPEATP